MHKSSESIAAIAAALAKAQTALVNPEKTMTATIREEGRGSGRGTKLPLCAAVGRARACSQGAGPARACGGADHEHR